MDAIVIENLTKRLGKRRILSNLNLEVLENETIAVLGLKDSGKTTLAKILFNYIKPSKGNAYIYDLDCKKDSKAIKESVSLIPQDPIFDGNLRASTIFKNTLNFHNLKNTDEVEKLCSHFDFNPRSRVIDMDENQKRLLSIINALIIRPRLVIVDEALKELDSKQKDSFFSYLNDLKNLDGLTVLLFTDSLIDAQRYCDRAAYLYKGEIKDIEYLRDKTSNDKIVKIFSPFDNINAFLDIDARLIKNEPYEKIFYYDKDMMILSRVIANCNIANYSIEDSSLSDKIKAYFENEDFVSMNNFENTQESNVDKEETIETTVIEENSEVDDINATRVNEPIVTEVTDPEDISKISEKAEVTDSELIPETSEEVEADDHIQNTKILSPLVDKDHTNHGSNGVEMNNGFVDKDSDSQENSTLTQEDIQENKEDI